MDDFAIKVEHVSKTFKLPHEKTTSLKSHVINFYRRKKTFEVQQALKNVSFEIKKGEFFGIVGKNGGGKSTLLKTLAGIYAPTEGQVHIRGKLTPFIELGVGFNPELTGRENVFLNGALLGFNRTEMEALYEDIVSFAELARFMDQKLKNYSSGMQVRLAFSIAIRAQSDILLLDEVLAVGDAAFQQKCYNYFEELKLRKQTVVFVSHDMGSVRRFCDRAVLIEHGRVKQTGKPEEIADQYVLDNIATPQQAADTEGANQETAHVSLTLDSSKNAAHTDTLQLTANYKIQEEFEPVLGISVVRDGSAVADLNSRAIELKSEAHTNHTVKLSFATKTLNPGLYSINISIFRKQGMELLASQLNAAQFVITGKDDTRGAATYLDGGWSQ